jgi:hypothetical protein
VAGSTVSLDDYLRCDAQALDAHQKAFADEYEFAKLIFLLGQEVWGHVGFSDSDEDRAVAALVGTSLRYYAAATGLFMRGHHTEAFGTIRTALEAGAYAVQIRLKPQLAKTWIGEDDWKKRKAAFGSDTSMFRQPLLAHLEEHYGLYSEHGTHARFYMAARGMDAPKGSGNAALYFGDDPNNTGRFFFGHASIGMRDLIEKTYIPLFWGELNKAPAHIRDLVKRSHELHRSMEPKWRQQMDEWKGRIDSGDPGERGGKA